MRKVLKIFLVLMMVVGLIGTAHATTSILYFNDGVLGTDQMAAALASLVGPAYSVTTATDLADFTTKIASPGAYNLGIFMIQTATSDPYDNGISALGAFVAAGGRSIYTDSSSNTDYAAFFGAAWTGNVNQSSFTVTGPLAAGITNPVALSNPGWGTFSMGVDGPVVAATFSNSDGAIVIGQDGRCITNGFLSDTFVDGSTGVQLYLNEIGYLTDQVPLPGAVWLLGSGLLGMGLLRGRMRKD